MANVTQSALSDTVKTQYERRLLTRALPRMIHGRWGMKARISKFGSLEFRKYSALSAITTALTEGTTPAEQSSPTITTTTVTPLFYGSWLGFTDEIEMTAYDAVLSEMSSILGEQCGLSADTLVRNNLVANATIDWGANQTAIGNLDYPAHEISYSDILKQVAALEANSALPVEGEDFIVIIHPHAFASLMADPTFVNMFIQESPNSAVRSGYVGRLLRCQIFVTSNAYEYTDQGAGSTTDVDAHLFIGRESYGTVGMAGAEVNLMFDGQGPEGKPLTGQQIKPVEIIMKPVGSAGADDPLNQRGSLAWKMTLATQVLNSSWITNLESVNVFSDD